MQQQTAPNAVVAQARVRDAAHLRGEFDPWSRDRLDAALAPLAGRRHAVIDVRDVTYAGVTLLNGVAALLRKRRRRFGDDPVRIVGAAPIVRRLFGVSDLAEYVRFEETLS